MNIKYLLGKKLQQIRKKRGMTQEYLAELVGLDTSSISHIENGKYYPTAENLDKILDTLKIKPSELFAFESFSNKQTLIDEMVSTMQDNDNLTKLMYNFYLCVKNI